MPFISPQLIKKQLAKIPGNNYDAIVPYTSKGIEPLHGIYHFSMKENIEQFLNKPGSHAVRSFLNGINTYYWPVKEEKTFININTPKDLNYYENH
jgi:molybdopterin-guanine dinucleotide biosynthesis protein A